MTLSQHGPPPGYYEVPPPSQSKVPIPKGATIGATPSSFIPDNLLVTFLYSMRNNTSWDYRLPDNPTLMYKEKGNPTLKPLPFETRVQGPLVPPNESVEITMESKISCNGDQDCSSDDIKRVNRFLYRKLHAIDAFFVFGESRRYQIMLPSGLQNMKPE